MKVEHLLPLVVPSRSRCTNPIQICGGGHAACNLTVRFRFFNSLHQNNIVGPTETQDGLCYGMWL